MIDHLSTSLGWRSDPDTVLPFAWTLGQVMPDQQAPTTPIVLAAGATPIADAMLDRVAALARSSAVEVIVLRVIEPLVPRTAGVGTAPRRDMPSLVPGDPYALADAQHQVDWLATRLHIRGVAADGWAILGRLPETILETADRIGAILIALSSDPPRPPGGAADASTGTAIAQQSRQPTIIVHDDDPATCADIQPPRGSTAADDARHSGATAAAVEGGRDGRA